MLGTDIGKSPSRNKGAESSLRSDRMQVLPYRHIRPGGNHRSRRTVHQCDSGLEVADAIACRCHAVLKPFQKALNRKSVLSFREALRFYHGLEFPKWTLEDILSHPLDLWDMVASKCKPIAYFKEYLEKGYYPFLLEGEDDYFIRIEQVINYIIETELPQICKVDVANIRKVQALIKLIAEEVPLNSMRTSWPVHWKSAETLSWNT